MPGRFPLVLPVDGTLRLFTRGSTDVRCRLFDGDGAARGGERGPRRGLELRHRRAAPRGQLHAGAGEPDAAAGPHARLRGAGPGVRRRGARRGRHAGRGHRRGARLAAPRGRGRAAAGGPARQDALLLRAGGRARRGGVAAHGRARVPDAARAGHHALARARVDAGPAHQGEHRRGGAPPGLSGGGFRRARPRARRCRSPAATRRAAASSACPRPSRARCSPCGPEASLEAGDWVFGAPGATGETKLALTERVDTLEDPEESRAPLSRSIPCCASAPSAGPAPAARERALRRPGLPGVPAGGRRVAAAQLRVLRGHRPHRGVARALVDARGREGRGHRHAARRAGAHLVRAADARPAGPDVERRARRSAW